MKHTRVGRSRIFPTQSAFNNDFSISEAGVSRYKNLHLSFSNIPDPLVGLVLKKAKSLEGQAKASGET